MNFTPFFSPGGFSDSIAHPRPNYIFHSLPSSSPSLSYAEAYTTLSCLLPIHSIIPTTPLLLLLLLLFYPAPYSSVIRSRIPHLRLYPPHRLQTHPSSPRRTVHANAYPVRFICDEAICRGLRCVGVFVVGFMRMALSSGLTYCYESYVILAGVGNVKLIWFLIRRKVYMCGSFLGLGACISAWIMQLLGLSRECRGKTVCSVYSTRSPFPVPRSTPPHF